MSKTKRTACKASRKDSQRLVTVKSEPRCEEENLWNTRADCQSFSESDIAYVLLVTKTEDLDLICHTQARPSKLQGFLFESAPPDGSEIWPTENTGIDTYQLRDLQTCPGLVNSLVKSEAAPPGDPDICPSEYNYMCNIETETEYTYGDENINNGPNSKVFMDSCDDRYVYQHVWNQPVVQLDRLNNLDGLLGVENSSTGRSMGEAPDSGSEIWLSGSRPVEPKGFLAVRETKPKIVEVTTSNCEDWIQIAKNQPVVKLDRLCNTDILCHSKNSSSSMDVQNVALRQQNEQEDFGSSSQACTSEESVSESKKCTQIRVISKNGRKGYDLSEPGIVQSKGPLVVNADGCLDKYQYARYQPLVSLAKLPSSGSDNRSAIGKVGEKVSLVQQCLPVSDSENTRYQPLVSLVKLPSSCSDNRSAIGRVGEKVSVVQQCIPVSDSHELNTRSPEDVPAACNVQQEKSVGRDAHMGCYSARGEVCERRHSGQGSDLARRDGRGVAHEHSCDSAKFQRVVRLRRSDVLLESDSNLTSSRVKMKPSRGTFANAKTKLSSRKSNQGFDVALADKVLSDDGDDDCVMMTTNTCDDMNQSPKHQSVVKLLRFPNVYTLQDKEESLKSVRVKKIQSFREQNFGAKNSNCCSSSGTCTVNVTETESSNSDTEHEYDGTLPNTVLVDDDCDDDVNNTCEDRYKSAKHQPIDRMQRSANVHSLTDNEESLSLMRVIKIASAKERSLQRRHCDCVSKIGTPRVACTLNGKRVSSFRHADQKCGDPLSGTALSDHGDSDDANGVVSSSSEERYGNAKYQPVVMLEKLSCVGENPYAMAFSRDACPKKVDCNGHVKLHSRENRLACTICEKIFRHSLHFRQRMIQHKGEKSLTFNTCEESLKQAVKRMPTTRHPGKETYICETNKKTFRLSSVLERHTRRHSVKKVYNREKSCAPLSRQNRRLALQTIAKLHTCNVCQKGFIRHDHLKRHMSIHTGKTPCKGVVHEKDMTQLGAVSVHKRQNTTGRDYKHKISEDSCTQIDSFKGHEGEVLCHLKRHLRRQTVEKSQTCEPCGKVFQSRFDLSRHIRKHTGKMPFTCKVCAKSFDQPNVLKKHIRIHTVGEILCTSKTSRKGFKQPNHLRKHTSVHFADKPELHTCDICQKIFNHSGNLKRHLLIHTGEKPYTCKVCRRSFNDPCILKRHLIIHTGEKPYTCKVCKRSFNDHGNLRRHLIIHTGEKPYTCKVCQRSFNNRSNLRRHLIIHTKKPYTCKICSRGFNEPDKFERHTRVHTGKKNQTPVRSVGKDMRRHTLIHMGEKP